MNYTVFRIANQQNETSRRYYYYYYYYIEVPNKGEYPKHKILAFTDEKKTNNNK